MLLEKTPDFAGVFSLAQYWQDIILLSNSKVDKYVHTQFQEIHV